MTRSQYENINGWTSNWFVYVEEENSLKADRIRSHQTKLEHSHTESTGMYIKKKMNNLPKMRKLNADVVVNFKKLNKLINHF